MRNKWKRIFAVIIFAISIMGTTEVYATETSSSIYNTYRGDLIFFDEREGVYVYQTTDVKKTSSTFYRTLGIELSRINRGVNPMDEVHSCAETLSENDPHYYADVNTIPLNSQWSRNGKQRQYVIINLDDEELGVHEYEYENSSGSKVIVTSYTFTEEYLLGKLDIYPEWKAEVLEQQAAGESVYVGVDCVITMFRNGVQQGWIE